MVNARAKGAAFERECAKKINAMLETTHLDDRVSRNLNQYQEKNTSEMTTPWPPTGKSGIT